MPAASLNKRVNSSFIASLVVLAAVWAVPAGAQDVDQIPKIIDDIRSGPSIYYTPEASAYFASLGNYSVNGLSVNKDAAQRSLRAVAKLGNLTLNQARGAVPVLIDYFPKAIHVVQIRQATFSSEDKGTFEDAVSTYVMNAKNQLLLSSSLLDYNSLAMCENFIEGPYDMEMLTKQVGASGAIIQAIFNLKISFTIYAGECALSRMSGLSLGHDPSAWRQWWQNTTAAAPAPVTTTAPGVAAPYTYTVTSPNTVVITKNDYADIVVGGKYHVQLSTGDDFTGTVESRNDSSMVLETTAGKPYSFTFSLMQNYQVIELPRQKSAQQTQTAPPSAAGVQTINFDELRIRGGTNQKLEVKIANGSTFRGRVLSISEDGLKMDVDGSMISITRDMIQQIVVLQGPPQQQYYQNNQTPPAVVDRPQAGFDTLWIKSASGDRIVYGAILDEGDDYVTLKYAEGGDPHKFARNEIARIIKHSAESGENALARYAKPLSCPRDMFLVDMPPNRGSKPFFKVCVDRYEYPNRANAVPRTNIPFDEARQLCGQQRKRLCTSEEWLWACGGLDGFAYPYGNTFEQDKCNNDTRMVESSGNRTNCVSTWGGYDMAGNVFEWVLTDKSKLALMGGPFSKCQTVSPAQNADAKPQSGLRCCKSN